MTVAGMLVFAPGPALFILVEGLHWQATSMSEDAFRIHEVRSVHRPRAFTVAQSP
jgi:hypothetical protein